MSWKEVDTYRKIQSSHFVNAEHVESFNTQKQKYKITSIDFHMILKRTKIAFCVYGISWLESYELLT